MGYLLDRLWKHTQCLTLTLPIDYTVHRALLEYHLVLSQSPGLVADYEVDLPQLFDQIGCPTQSVLFGLRIIHFGVLPDQVTLAKLEHLDYDIEGDWYQMRVGDPEGQEVKEGSETTDTSLEVKVLGLLPNRLVPGQAHTRVKGDQEELECEDRIQHVVHHSHDR